MLEVDDALRRADLFDPNVHAGTEQIMQSHARREITTDEAVVMLMGLRPKKRWSVAGDDDFLIWCGVLVIVRFLTEWFFG